MRLLLSLLLLSYLVHFSSSLRVTKTQAYPAVQGRFTTVETFDYYPNGSLNLEWLGSSESEVSQIGFFLCSRDEFEDFRNQMRKKDGFTDYCRYSANPTHSSFYSTTYHQWTPKSSAPACSINMMNIMNPILLNYTVESHDRYTLGLLNCAPCGYATCQFSKSVRLKYTLLNPGSELSATDQPLLFVYPIYAALWVVVVVGILLVMAKGWYDTWGYEGRESLTYPEIAKQTHGAHRFHAVFVCVAVSKFCVVLLSWAYWFVFNQDGNRDSMLRVATNLAYALSECFLFCILLLLAHGWCILSRLSNSEVRALTSSILALLSSLLFFSFYDIVTSLLVLYVFLLPNIFSNLTQNIECLKFRISWVESVEDEIEEEDHEVWEWTRSALYTKLSAYHNIRTTIALYFISHFAAKMTPYFLPWYLEYLSNTFQEAIVLLFVVFTFAIINPLKAEDGLFWIPSFGGDHDNYEAWVEATQRAYDQLMNGEHQRFQDLVSYYTVVTKSLHLVKFPSRLDDSLGEVVAEGKGEAGEGKEESLGDKKEKEIGGEDEETGKLRNVYLAILMGQEPGLPLEEGEEHPNGEEEEEELQEVVVDQREEEEREEGWEEEDEAGEEDELLSPTPRT
uniref:GPR180/TMEM145 transmembrane domain-containing protein n=1 Tax=Paramoeba aestuarina TaxID=180227 RepID=A0A7S4JRA3_9EUKA|mmetsp:Transcript_12529/g.19173  ORF Transcript_12529/g.19173 Transcript_12529/m.19173 type:complete len:621 (+) Transcript_12529:220-2082(+)|eukprot:CAMPEP_0201526508 /NCGR_PEP_ID=MMETSP0161_2-20130828/31996_1 /ASSEMBLY_ACC=CAM_ASM_000251 /TAXON_ID=180227 /ORGANISM="Neoparamoeba aestuarina, Strain SoJaBio B1-5/56/2" /LENGTH=620 /DNA_ID=CAMNT_0047926927 /DNA_START=139 /DNA_END=2001 /DNA_ORIENTATION=+